jgi:hypothetical protein
MLFVLYLSYEYVYESLWTSGYYALDYGIGGVLIFLDFFSPVEMDFIFIFNFTFSDGPGVDSASNRNEYLEYFRGGGLKCRCLGLTTLPPSCADYHVILEPQPPGILWAYPGLHRDCFICTFTL